MGLKLTKEAKRPAAPGRSPDEQSDRYRDDDHDDGDDRWPATRCDGLLENDTLLRSSEDYADAHASPSSSSVCATCSGFR